MSLASLLEQVAAERDGNEAAIEPGPSDITADRYGCGAPSDREKRACSLYLSLLGPTTEQLSATCPCRG